MESSEIRLNNNKFLCEGMIESDEKKCIRAAADSMKATFTLQQALTLTGKPDLQFINDRYLLFVYNQLRTIFKKLP